MKNRLYALLTLIALILIALLAAACDSAPGTPAPSQGAASATVTIQGATPTETHSVPATAQPSATNNATEGVNLQAKVIDFQVWQDFMPGLPTGGPPLHALLTLEVDSAAHVTTANTSGTITITRSSGEVVLTTNLGLDQQSDDLGMGQPGPRTLHFNMQPSSISAKLTENEPLTGEVRIQLAGQQVMVKLPETPVMFTH